MYNLYFKNKLNEFSVFINKKINNYRFGTHSYALARTFLAFGTLVTLLFNNPVHLFNPTNFENPIYIYNPFGHISIFFLLKDHLSLARFIAVIILLITLTGFRPKYTCIFHWWVSLSINISSFVIDGGDQITQILTLLLIPICISDNRSNHWNKNDNLFRNNIVALSSYYLIRLQICYIYLEASIGKLKVNEWKDGTAIYYWMKNSFIGNPEVKNPLIEFLVKSPTLLTLTTWSGIILEFGLFMCITSFAKHRSFFLYLGIFFHFMIFLLFGLFSFMFAMSAALLLYLSNFKIRTYDQDISHSSIV